MSSIQKKRRQCDVLSRRLLTTFRLNDDILLKFKSKGFTLKSEIEFISDSDLQAICGMTDDELETIERVVRKSHMSELRCETGLELKNTIPQFIHTGSYSLNRSINGGLQVGKITQMVAESGSGKTQIWSALIPVQQYCCLTLIQLSYSMQCCVNVQLPPKNGGLSASALYIDTENSFRPERILQMAKYKIDHIAGLKDSLTPTLMGSRIHLFKCNQPEDLVNILVDKVEIFIDQHPDIKLVIVDSIAYLFRYDFQGTYPKKDNQLSQIAVKLREIAHHKKVAVS